MLNFNKSNENIPIVDEKLKHVAFIMDGNGRWATSRGLVREQGHIQGAKNLRNVLKHCHKLGIKVVTVYAFSTENWGRPESEVKALMKLLDFYLDDCAKDAKENKIRYRLIGDMSVFSDNIKEKIAKLESISDNYEITLNVALNYGGRAEIVHACNELIKQGKTNITEKDISDCIYTHDSPDPDLIVRTGGDLRISNFLLWQSAYSELYFTDVLWPDLSEYDINEAVRNFYSRKRRFGKV